VWVDRTGTRSATLGAPGGYHHVELSPDGQRAAVDLVDPQSGQSDIWLIDGASATPTRFTFDPGRFQDPRWSPNGDRLLFANRSDLRLYQKPSSGAGREEQVYLSSDVAGPSDWSPDGLSIVFRRIVPGSPGDLSMLSLAGDRRATPVPQTSVRGTNGRFSPDGHWLAYESSESGRKEVYVQPLPTSGAKFQISHDGGSHPRWRRDGKELFYRRSGGTLMAVPVTASPTLQVRAPVRLFDTEYLPPSVNEYPYAVSSADGRFLVISPVTQSGTVPITVVVNWDAALKR
jgi:Tol biopolymer transport system component